MDIRERIEAAERQSLAPGAAAAAESKGRAVPEKPHPFRTAFMRDRDRILHSKAFRRLAHKTQVFVAPEGDHHRVRLTHTLEVAQVARTIARALKLNEDLAEAICLGHDLGHTPFGHLGEEVLAEFLGRPFRHNAQSLRIVDCLEVRRVATLGNPEEFRIEPGLNLTEEVRDGILNHTWSMPLPSTLEGEVARFADRIAYLSHDIDDALRAGVLEVSGLPEVTRHVLGSTASSQIDTMVGSVIDSSETSQNHPKLSMAPDIFNAMLETRNFMFEKVYSRPELRDEQLRLSVLLRELLDYYESQPDQLPQGTFEADFQTRLIDYVAGMTDRFALREHARLIETERADHSRKD